MPPRASSTITHATPIAAASPPSQAQPHRHIHRRSGRGGLSQMFPTPEETQPGQPTLRVYYDRTGLCTTRSDRLHGIAGSPEGLIEFPHLWLIITARAWV